jgi:hypothetical protein
MKFGKDRPEGPADGFFTMEEMELVEDRPEENRLMGF